jgi:Flp pilus assembly protein TadG
MSAPDPSRLDANQVLQGAYDEANGRLRTDSTATIVNADIDVQLDSADDNVAIASPDGDFLEINADGSINVNVSGTVDVTGSEVSVSGTVDVEVTSPVAISGTVDVSGSTVSISGTVPVSITEPLLTTIDQPIYVGGTINGQYSGQKFGFVYNSRQQILDSHDRIADFIYADFGTKNQRITEIEYTSATFPGITVKRTFTYTLVSGKYKRDNEIWSLI